MYTKELYHHGIKGQRWGVRRFQNPDGTLTEQGKEHYGKTLNRDLNEQTFITTKARNGDEILISQLGHNKFQRLIANGSSRITKNMLNTKQFDFFHEGNKVGEIELFQESDDTINGVWLGVNEKERGKGYAQAVMDALQKDLKAKGYKHFTLEVPGNSPDARHIYEKRGFKVVRELSSPDEDYVWGGLTAMRLDL